MVLGTGDECARVICGAVRELLPEDLDLRWPLAKGERVRGRSGSEDMERFENGDGVLGVSGAVDLRGVYGRGDWSIGRAGKGLLLVRVDSSTSSMTSSWTACVMAIGGSEEGGSMTTTMRPA